MRRNSKLTLVIALLTLMVFLAGCQDKKAATPPKSKPPVASKTEQPAAAPAEPEAPAVAEAPAAPAAPAKTETPAPAAPAKTETPTPAKPAAPAKTETPAPAKPAAPAKTETPAPAAPAKTETPPAKSEAKPEQPEEPTAPGGLTGDKAKAYNLLVNSKYSGKASASFDAKLTNVIIIGEANPKLTVKSSGMTTTFSGTNIPALVGGNFQDKSCPKVPFIEIANGKDSDILEFLKKASNVKVDGNTITISKSEPPDSIIVLLNSILPGKVTYKAADNDLSCKIKVGSTSVEAIDDILIKGTAHGSKDMPSTVTGSIKY